MNKETNIKGLHIDMFLNKKPEEIVDILSTKDSEELRQFRASLDYNYHNQVKPLINMGNKQLLALQDDEKQIEEINANLLVVGALAQKIEDTIHIINAILKDRK